MSVQSDDLNFLIYRYLEESGFVHSAFTFGRESNIQHMNVNSSVVPAGALISIVLKGLLYTEAEVSLSEDGTEMAHHEPLSLLESVQPEVISSRQKYQGGPIATQALPSAAASTTVAAVVSPVAEKESPVPAAAPSRSRSKTDVSTPSRAKPEPVSRAKVEVKVKTEPPPAEVQMDVSVPAEPQGDVAMDESAPPSAPAAVPIPAPVSAPVPVPTPVSAASFITSPPVVQASTAPAPVTPPADTECKATVLRGHSSEVFICAWNPRTDALASGAGDGTACIWNDGAATVLHHEREGAAANSGDDPRITTDVTSLDWNHDGSLLATASYDHHARIWSPQGRLLHQMSGHQGPIFAIKWNRKGTFLLTGSVDKTAVVWDPQTGGIKQQFAYHTAPCLDIDWQGSSIFATCSQDRSIHICRVGYDRPLKILTGHVDEVNTVRWNPAGNVLASCSDDHTAKLWTMRDESYVHSLESHTREIYTIKWSKTGPFTQYPNAPLHLATASFDSTVRLWDAETGVSKSCLDGHNEAVYSVAFSPDARLLASGSFDNCVHIWSTKDARLLHKYKGNSGVFEVCFNRDGTKIAASSADQSVVVLDIRNLQSRLN